MQLELSLSKNNKEKINFWEDPSHRVDVKGWICFDVNHADDVVHVLYMSYMSPHSCPCHICIGNKEMNIGIACGRTGNEWPHIESFRFIPDDEVVKDEQTEKTKRRMYKYLWHNSKGVIQSVVSTVHHLGNFDIDNGKNCCDTTTT
eukprot:3104654-Ditylum_brightwellii.AAC.1